jgi:hypothetical protein
MRMNLCWLHKPNDIWTERKTDSQGKVSRGEDVQEGKKMGKMVKTKE